MNSSNTIILIRAQKSDIKRLFEWRNNADIRKHSINNQLINWETHTAWFEDLLSSEYKYILIGEIEQKPIGVLRYDTDDDIAEVSVYILPGLTGKGYGTKLIEEGNKWVKKNLPHINKIKATILTNNEVSIKAFRKAGFEPHTVGYILKF